MIGVGAGFNSAPSGSICLNASGAQLNPLIAGCYINPIRNLTQSSKLGYDITTFEITYETLQNITATGGQSTTTFDEDGKLYRCHIFTTTGAYTLTVTAISANAFFDFCLIGGGGYGGAANLNTNGGGGGGAGTLIVAYNVPFTTLGNITGSIGQGGLAISSTAAQNTTIVLPAPSSVTITANAGPNGGSGGAGSAGGSGGSSFTQNYLTPFTTTLGASGGGGMSSSGGAGGSGGTATGATNAFPKSAFSDMIFGGGRAGGSGATSGNGGGGGGGNGNTGSAGAGAVGGAGGAGFALLFDNTLRAVCCGGGGGAGTTGGAGGAAGGTTSGGAGGTGSGGAASANTGSGGGGAFNFGTGGNGGSGLVMIRYVIG